MNVGMKLGFLEREARNMQDSPYASPYLAIFRILKAEYIEGSH